MLFEGHSASLDLLDISVQQIIGLIACNSTAMLITILMGWMVNIPYRPTPGVFKVSAQTYMEQNLLVSVGLSSTCLLLVKAKHTTFVVIVVHSRIHGKS